MRLLAESLLPLLYRFRLVPLTVSFDCPFSQPANLAVSLLSLDFALDPCKKTSQHVPRHQVSAFLLERQRACCVHQSKAGKDTGLRSPS